MMGEVKINEHREKRTYNVDEPDRLIGRVRGENPGRRSARMREDARSGTITTTHTTKYSTDPFTKDFMRSPP